MATLKQGDRVRIVARSATAEDSKTGLYFPHYAGLPGTITHLYSDGEAAVEIDLEALSPDVRARHNSVRDQMKTKWLEGLSEEGRARLTDREKDFRLRYVVLVAVKDLERDKTPVAAAPIVSEETSDGSDEAPRRPTSEDLSRAEEEELLRRRRDRSA